jgi:hypothetical protein
MIKGQILNLYEKMMMQIITIEQYESSYKAM